MFVNISKSQQSRKWVNEVNLSLTAKNLEGTTLFTYFRAIMPLSESERECYLSYFIKYNGNHHCHFQIIKQLNHTFETN